MLFLSKKAFILFLSNIFLAHVLFSQQILTLETATRQCLENNFQVQLGKIELDMAVANNTRGNAGMLPRVGVLVGNSLSNNNIRQRFADGRVITRDFVFSNTTNAAVAANWTIFDGYRMSATKQRLEVLESLGFLNIKAVANEVIGQMITAYFEVGRQQSLFQNLQTLLNMSEERLRLATEKLNAGVVAKTEVLQTTLDRNVLIDNIMRQKNAIEQAKINLQTAIGQPKMELAEDFNIDTKNLFFEENKLMTLETLLAQVFEKNIDLKMQQQFIFLSQISQKEAKSLRQPTLALNGSYGFALTENQAGFALSNFNLGLNVGIAATLPLYDGGNVRRLRQLATLEEKVQEKRFENLKMQLTNSIRKAFLDYQNAKMRLESEAKNLPIAKENTFIASERYRLGQSSNSMELRAAEKTLEDIEIRLTNLKFDAQFALIELKKATFALF